MYNTWTIATYIFPFWAAIMLWLTYLLFRGEKVGKELVVSIRKEFYSKCYENERIERQPDPTELMLRAKGLWIERDLSNGRAETDYSQVPKRKEGFDFTQNIPNQNHITEGYKAFKESKKEVITKPISLIPESTTSYDVELFKKSIMDSIYSD